MTPLLSIIIPTKNRQYTAVFAVRSVLNISSDRIEVVVQDCSDENILEQMLLTAFPGDKRVKYFYSEGKPSLTENWNQAIAHTSGKYICGIGDDDIVLPYCLEITEWLEANKIESVLGPLVTYIWKDAYIGSFSNSRLTHSTVYTGEIFQVDIQKEFAKKARNCGFGYTDDLPNLYHGIISKQLLEENKKVCGHYLASTSFDVYNAMMLPAFVTSFYYIDFPITMRGVSGKSNANRIDSNKFDAHFNEFKGLHIPEILPKILSAEVSIAESSLVAFGDTGRQDLMQNMNLAVVYGKTAALNLNRMFTFYRQYQKAKNAELYKDSDFFVYFFKFLKDRLRGSFRNRILKIMFKVMPNADAIIARAASKRKVVADDILHACAMLQDHLVSNDMKIRYSGPVKQHVSQKMPWD